MGLIRASGIVNLKQLWMRQSASHEDVYFTKQRIGFLEQLFVSLENKPGP